MNNNVELFTHSEMETYQLAAALSNYASVGDCFGLSGDLGVGKSVFARGFLRALAGSDDLEVPSPTFTLVQVYEELRIKASHYDLYRIIESAEVDELGLEDALVDGVALVEWPENYSTDRFVDRLMVLIEDISPAKRKFTLTGYGSWEFKLQRWHLSTGFLKQAGWGAIARSFLQGDASHRRYERLCDPQRCGILMDMPTMPDGPIIRDQKPYSTLAHLAEGVKPFIVMTDALRSLGLSAPEIFASQSDDGFLLLEDLGAQVFFEMAARGEDMTMPLRAAVDVLVHLAEKLNDTKITTKAKDHNIADYDADALQIEIELLPDWYWPRQKGAPIDLSVRTEFLELWQPLWRHLERCPRIWTLRDYHSPNLIWLPERQGVARVGLLDYQDAVFGAPAYDLMSLLQDARRDVAPEVETEMYDYYWQQIDRTSVGYDRHDFDIAYAILGAQRSVKILGIFARLADRDNKPGYLAHIPRVRNYLERNLQHPHMKNLKNWFDHHLPMEAE